jgi:outer membrane immunogenic protein
VTEIAEFFRANDLGSLYLQVWNLYVEICSHGLGVIMKISGILLASAAGAMSIPAAQAADMAYKAPPIAAPSWAGWYIGGHAGVASVEINRDFTDGGTDDFSGRRTSFIGGGQIGYNWQSGTLVYGLEADGSFLSGKQSFDDGDASNKLPWLVTARLRMGLAVGDTMAYVTGGVAFGQVKTAIFDFETYSQSKTRIGWTIGGGVEHMINRNWSIGLEGLFVDLGSKTYCAKDCELRRVSGQAVIGRVKANYKF